MPITVVCPHCQARATAGSGAAGMTLRCPRCGGDVPVNTASPAPGATAATPAFPLPPPPAAAQPPPPPPPVAASRLGAGLGLGAAVVGVAATLVSALPCVGYFGLPISGLGLALGVAAVVADSRGRGVGLGLGAAGIGLSAISAVLGLYWLTWQGPAFTLGGGEKREPPRAEGPVVSLTARELSERAAGLAGRKVKVSDTARVSRDLFGDGATVTFDERGAFFGLASVPASQFASPPPVFGGLKMRVTVLGVVRAVREDGFVLGDATLLASEPAD